MQQGHLLPQKNDNTLEFFYIFCINGWSCRIYIRTDGLRKKGKGGKKWILKKIIAFLPTGYGYCQY